MVSAWPDCHNIAFAFGTMLCSDIGHHAHPLANHINSRIGPATMQAFKSRAIRRDGFIGDRIAADGRNVK
jgi:hypothetical protein